MSAYSFVSNGHDLVEYIDGEKTMIFGYDLFTPISYIRFSLFDHWEPPHEKEVVHELVRAEIADRFYRYLIEQGKDETTILILDRIIGPLPEPPRSKYLIRPEGFGRPMFSNKDYKD